MSLLLQVRVVSMTIAFYLMVLVNFYSSTPYRLSTSILSPKLSKFQKLSNEFQKHLQGLQYNYTSFSGKVLNCGLRSGCGMGCQIHYRMTCVMLSNAYQIPFVHYSPSWPYEDAWDRYLTPLGLNNTIDNNTISWNDSDDTIKGRDHESDEQFEEALLEGVPLPKHMAQMINETFASETQALHWILGQYAKFSFQLNSEGLKMISMWRKKLNISQEPAKVPLLGFHVRKTDKKYETDIIRNPEDFMEEAMLYRDKLKRNNVTFDHIDVFVASEDHTVLPTFQNKFASKEWNFIGFPANRTFGKQSERYSQLAQIIRDIIILSECDFVICTLTSNVCRLILEMKLYQEFEKETNLPKPENLVKSLDRNYTFKSYFGNDVPLKLTYI